MAEEKKDPPADWREGLPDDLKANPGLKDMKDIPTMVKTYLEAQSMLGRSIRLPSKEAGAEDRKAFRARLLELKDAGVIPVPEEGEDDTELFKRLGYPEKADAYAFDKKGYEDLVDDGDVVELREAAHKAKLTPKQFQNFLTAMTDKRAPVAREMRGKHAAGIEALKKEWGEAFDTKRGALLTMLESYKAPDPIKTALEEGRMDADSMRWLNGVLEAFGGDPIEIRQQKQPEGGKQTRSELLERVGELERRMATMNQGDPEYQDLVKRRVELLGRAYPN